MLLLPKIDIAHRQGSEFRGKTAEHANERKLHGDDVDDEAEANEAALVELAQSHGNTNGQAQEAFHLHGRAEQPVERLATRILEHRHGSSALADKVQRRPHGPRAIQLILQDVFVGEAIEA
jgi:hypothetical protein